MNFINISNGKYHYFKYFTMNNRNTSSSRKFDISVELFLVALFEIRKWNLYLFKIVEVNIKIAAEFEFQPFSFHSVNYITLDNFLFCSPWPFIFSLVLSFNYLKDYFPYRNSCGCNSFLFCQILYNFLLSWPTSQTAMTENIKTRSGTFHSCF